jgi:phytoene synthase
MVRSSDIDAAYRHCAELTRAHARNFWYGIRLLPSAKRQALSAIYAFARRVDDIADGNEQAEQKLTDLARLRERLNSNRVDPGDPVLLALVDGSSRFPIPLGAFEELLDGCAADVRGKRYETFDDLVIYCRQVAGSIGRLSLGVFGANDLEAAAPIADSLGVALQLTNIVRDIREDRRRGRVYLPAEDLRRFAVTLDLDAAGELNDSADLARLVAFQAQRARHWYTIGLRLLPMLDRRSAACCGAMAGIYSRLLRRISAEPNAVVRGRISVPKWEKAVVAALCVAGAGPWPGTSYSLDGTPAGRAPLVNRSIDDG